MADTLDSLSDAELLATANNLIAVISPDPMGFGLTAPFVSNLVNERDNFDTELATHNLRQAAARSQTIIKDGVQAALKRLIRDAKASSKAAGVGEAKVAEMGIPTASAAAPATATVPNATIDTSKRLQHTIEFRDAASPENKRKPKGTVGCEIWVKIDGPAPGNQKDCTFLSLDTKSPYVAAFEPEDAGKVAYYMIRWAFRDETVSPWGETVSATITG